MDLYIAFIDLTKAFDLVSRDGLFKVLPKIGCPLKHQCMVESFHINTNGTVHSNGSSSELFEIRSGVKQGCVLAPTLFGVFFGLLLKHAFDTTSEGIYLRSIRRILGISWAGFGEENNRPPSRYNDVYAIEKCMRKATVTPGLRTNYDLPGTGKWANRRKNVGLVAEVVRLVAEVVGDRKGQISRNKVVVMSQGANQSQQGRWSCSTLETCCSKS